MGRRVGYHESGYTAFDVDLTGIVKPGGRNLFAGSRQQIDALCSIAKPAIISAWAASTAKPI